MNSRAESVILVDGIARSYGDVQAVRDISFTVPRGGLVGLLGPNGAGKTTTVEMIQGFAKPEAGMVRVFGHDPASRDGYRELRERVGAVMQVSGHDRYLSVRETVAMHAGFHRDPRPVDEVLDEVGLAERAERRVRHLSGGELRRLDIATALVGQPELLLLDEPTTGFDPEARVRMWDTVAALRDAGTTILLTTHYMEEAQVLCDHVVIVVDGSTVASGTPDEIGRTLRLRSSITFTLPREVDRSRLPGMIREGMTGDHMFSARVEDPAPLLADACAWARDNEIALDNLHVRPPSLEDSYLALVGSTGEGSS